ncbi:MAG: hypothetical protein QGG54_09615 [Gammaproteobacteria bacterium]|nr:hypothetical protein [Gammaproteobacteria bacterium]
MRRLTNNCLRAFTLIELAVVVAIIFILVGSMVVMVPRIELRAAIARAKGDILLLEAALGLYEENERTLPPDKLDSKNVWIGTAPPAETVSNIMMVHYLTTNRSKSGYLELKTDNVERYSDANMDYNQADSMLVQKFSSVTRNPSERNIPVFQMLDPWGNPYVYDNNSNDDKTSFGIDGRPNQNPDFDLFSRGPNSMTGEDNGVDDDGDSTTDEVSADDSDERLFNGRERKESGELGDDINNFKTAK